jgi:cold shock CspA family protein
MATGTMKWFNGGKGVPLFAPDPSDDSPADGTPLSHDSEEGPAATNVQAP